MQLAHDLAYSYWNDKPISHTKKVTAAKCYLLFQVYKSDWNFIQIEVNRIEWAVYMKAFQSECAINLIIHGLFGCMQM